MRRSTRTTTALAAVERKLTEAVEEHATRLTAMEGRLSRIDDGPATSSAEGASAEGGGDSAARHHAHDEKVEALDRAVAAHAAQLAKLEQVTVQFTLSLKQFSADSFDDATRARLVDDLARSLDVQSAQISLGTLSAGSLVLSGKVAVADARAADIIKDQASRARLDLSAWGESSLTVDEPSTRLSALEARLDDVDAALGGASEQQRWRQTIDSRLKARRLGREILTPGPRRTPRRRRRAKLGAAGARRWVGRVQGRRSGPERGSRRRAIRWNAG